MLQLLSQAKLPTEFGLFTSMVYRSSEGIDHIVLMRGEIKKENCLVRLHSECLTGDVFGSKRCDCGAQLRASLQKMAGEGSGILIYLRGHEGRGIGIGHKMAAYSLQDKGLDTVEANEVLGLPIDARIYQDGVAILKNLEIRSIRLLTNNPSKYDALLQSGIEIVERIALITSVSEENRGYLRTKAKKMGHWMAICD